MKAVLGVGIGLFVAPIVLVLVVLPLLYKMRNPNASITTMGPGARFVYGRRVC